LEVFGLFGEISDNVFPSFYFYFFIFIFYNKKQEPVKYLWSKRTHED